MADEKKTGPLVRGRRNERPRIGDRRAVVAARYAGPAQRLGVVAAEGAHRLALPQELDREARVGAQRSLERECLARYAERVRPLAPAAKRPAAERRLRRVARGGEAGGADPRARPERRGPVDEERVRR